VREEKEKIEEEELNGEGREVERGEFKGRYIKRRTKGGERKREKVEERWDGSAGEM
jgi:hypothetical protein